MITHFYKQSKIKSNFVKWVAPLVLIAIFVVTVFLFLPHPNNNNNLEKVIANTTMVPTTGWPNFIIWDNKLWKFKSSHSFELGMISVIGKLTTDSGQYIPIYRVNGKNKKKGIAVLENIDNKTEILIYFLDKHSNSGELF